MKLKRDRSVLPHPSRRAIVSGITAIMLMSPNRLTLTSAAADQTSDWAGKLIEVARKQIGVTVRYDGAYAALAFPGGDIPREVGVCTDVIVRAYRDAFAYDLQVAVNKDMKRNFSAYPKKWGLRRTDRNIDHRRVPNLQTFFRRKGAEIRAASGVRAYRPGDLITQMIDGRLPHIGIVSDRLAPSGRPMMIHNIGAGTQEEDATEAYPATGHYRFPPA